MLLFFDTVAKALHVDAWRAPHTQHNRQPAQVRRQRRRDANAACVGL